MTLYFQVCHCHFSGRVWTHPHSSWHHHLSPGSRVRRPDGMSRMRKKQEVEYEPHWRLIGFQPQFLPIQKNGRGHPLNSFHESPCSPIKIAIGMRYAVCITIFGHLHFEISWSNTRPPFFSQVCTPHVRSQRLSCGREIPSKKGLKTLPLCWIYSYLGYSRRGWGLLRTTTLHRTWKCDIANRNHCDIVQMDVHQCTRS